MTTVRLPGLLLALTLAIVPAARPAHAQEFAVVALESNAPEALVYGDSLFLGRADARWFIVPRSVRELRLIYPGGDAWSLVPARKEVDLRMADTLRVVLGFSYHYAVHTEPFAANVLLETPDGRELLGTTPLLHYQDEPVKGMLLLQKDGYELKRLTPGDRIWNRHEVTLDPLPTNPIAGMETELLRRPRDRWLNVAIGGLALASGALAVHYKMKADNRYDEYAVNGDPALRRPFERYDRYALVSLGAMQAGVGVLAIRLVLR